MPDYDSEFSNLMFTMCSLPLAMYPNMPFSPLFKTCACTGWRKKCQGPAKKEKPRKDKIPAAVLVNCSPWVQNSVYVGGAAPSGFSV